MDENTETLVQLILATDLTDRPELLQQAKIAFLDYLASALQAKDQPKVRKLAKWVSQYPGKGLLLGRKKTCAPFQAAFYNGFLSHYLDLDDAQASIAGHFSTVLFSLLLASAKASTTVQDFLTAYVVGAEVEGILGGFINPQHKWQGWHSTGTLGPIGGAAALSRLYKLAPETTAQVLSLGATQSSGLGLEAGSDGKPLHSGFAARNARYAYEMIVKAGLNASTKPFNGDNGWQKVFANLELKPADLTERWLKPGQILQPGLWMKLHPYCSAAICGEAACYKLFDKGWSLDKLREVTFHFPPGADKALHYKSPATGREGKFSMEYVAWQVLTKGYIQDELFELETLPEGFAEALPKLKRANDLPPVEKTVRKIKVTAVTEKGVNLIEEEDAPLGSPQHPFTEEDLREKLEKAGGRKWTKNLLEAVADWPDGTLAQVRTVLQE